MIKHGRKQKLKTGDEFDLIYAKKLYCYLHNNTKLVKKIKRGLNKRYRKEMKEEGKLDLEEEFDYIDKHFECAQKDTLINDLVACGLQEEKCN